MIEITVSDMRGRGKPGYIAKMVDGERNFLHAKSQDKYSTSKVEKTYEITEDGIYEVCDANFGGRKRNVQYIKVKNNEIVQKSYDLNEILLEDEIPKLPELTGTENQITWAISIRQKFLAKLKNQKKEIPDWAFKAQTSKFWIDNREKLK